MPYRNSSPGHPIDPKIRQNSDISLEYFVFTFPILLRVSEHSLNTAPRFGTRDFYIVDRSVTVPAEIEDALHLMILK